MENSFSKKLTIFLLVLIGFLHAQTSALVNWTCMPPDSQNVSAESGHLLGTKETGSSGFVVRDYANGPGPDQRWWPYADGAAVSWGEESEQVESRWVQFGVYTQEGFEFQCNEISVYLGAKGTGNIRANVAIDTCADFSNCTFLNSSELELVKNDDSLYTFQASVDLSKDDTLFVRIYPWYTGSKSTSKYLYVRNMTISGTTEAIEVPAYAVWPFEEDTEPVTSGALIASAESYSDAMKFYDITTLPTTDGADVTCGAIQTVSKSWNAEAQPVDSLWFQYAVEPQYGATFFVKEISMFLGGWFTSNMKTEIYYSTDPTFTTKTLLIADTLLSGNSVMPLSASLNDTVATGETFYLRVYPHNTEAVGWAKLVAVDSVIISGATYGATVELPTISTSSVSEISATFATCGGSVTNDGGATVTARGVCWSSSANPTIADNHTSDGNGAGSFTSNMTGLTSATEYFIRAFATNEAGTAYGSELSFTTLDSISVPTVITDEISNIMVTTAECGGDVTNWGGSEVTQRGICWSTSDNPTINDFCSEDGSGTGSYSSGMGGLSENTEYYVRAYATNSKGTGYGYTRTFTTQVPAEPVYKVVAADGSGDYVSVQAAFDDIPDYYTGTYTIYVKAGTYYEKLLLEREKVNVILKGENADSTILTYDDYAGIAGGTSKCYSVGIDADDFTAMDITFQNTVVNDGSFSDQQGVALRVNGDRQAYYNCKLLGYQDTYYTWGGRGTGRVYMKNCYIEGSVDFIFGRDIVLFDSCEIHINRQGGTLTAASTEPESKFGYVFMNCVLSADSIGFDGREITNFYLGRPWQQSPRTVFLCCEEPATLDPKGWLSWNVTPGLYAEYNCTGDGADCSCRHDISKQLTEEEAAEYSIENIFSKESNPNLAYDWIPETPSVAIDNSHERINTPKDFKLNQNYPNPFNPTTNIHYEIAKPTHVKIEIYDLTGRLVKKLVNKQQNTGYYRIQWNAENSASGMYIYRMSAGDYISEKKMLLLK